jgi:hypothetical protein
MRSKTIILCAALIGMVAAAAPCWGDQINGTVRVGGVIRNEDAGDLSVMQETYDIYEDFAITQINLYGSIVPQSFFSLNLANINLDNRAADFSFRVPGYVKLYANFDQSRYVYDALRNVVTDRKDARFSVSATPVRWLEASALYAHQLKDGDRMSYPYGGHTSNLGTSLDQVLHTGRFEVRAHRDRRDFAVAYDFSRFSDDQALGMRDRSGNVVSARVFMPCFFTPKLTHSLRASYGTQKLSELDLKYTLKSLQYMGALQPTRLLKLKYGFSASRVDDEATELLTDDFRHDIDAILSGIHGSLFAGYSYETRDDDAALTSYNDVRFGGSLIAPGKASASLKYARRSKNDVDNREKHTLLQESDTDHFSVSASLIPIEDLTVGVAYRLRNRDLPDIDVEIDGSVTSAFARYRYKAYGALMFDYSYSKDTYTDRVGGFETDNNSFTSKVEVDYIRDLKLSGGLTTVDIGKDLDIEKSIFFVEAGYTYDRVYQVDVRYNIYNFDDYLVLNRYYTANVVWVNFGYSFQIQ